MMKEKHTQKSEIKEGVSKGIFSGFLASLCCIGPLVIVLFGLGSISFALSISQYRPYFLGLGILFMIGAIFLHLNKKNKTCEINCFSVEGLKKEKKFLISIIISMVIIYIFAIYVLVPLISPTIYNGMAQKTATQSGDLLNQINENSDLRVLNLKINGMTCTGCASGLQSILQGLEGVIEAKVSYSKGIGQVIYNPKIITKEQIVNNAFSSPYSAEIISDKKK